MVKGISSNIDVYTPGSLRKNQYYLCVQAHFEELERIWEDRYQKSYGFRRPYVKDIIYKFLYCSERIILIKNECSCGVRIK